MRSPSSSTSSEPHFVQRRAGRSACNVTAESADPYLNFSECRKVTTDASSHRRNTGRSESWSATLRSVSLCLMLRCDSSVAQSRGSHARWHSCAHSRLDAELGRFGPRTALQKLPWRHSDGAAAGLHTLSLIQAQGDGRPCRAIREARVENRAVLAQRPTDRLASRRLIHRLPSRAPLPPTLRHPAPAEMLLLANERWCRA